jgi:hypothetical protein
MSASTKRWGKYLSKMKGQHDRYKAYLEKDKNRKKEQRANQVLSSAEIQRRRKMCRDRVRLHRLKQKMSKT